MYDLFMLVTVIILLSIMMILFTDYVENNEFNIWLYPILPLSWRYQLMLNSRVYQSYLNEKRSKPRLLRFIHFHKKTLHVIQLLEKWNNDNQENNEREILTEFISLIKQLADKDILDVFELEKLLILNFFEEDTIVFCRKERIIEYFLNSHSDHALDFIEQELTKHEKFIRTTVQLLNKNNPVSQEAQQMIKEFLIEIVKEVALKTKVINSKEKQQQLSLISKSFSEGVK